MAAKLLLWFLVIVELFVFYFIYDFAASNLNLSVNLFIWFLAIFGLFICYLIYDFASSNLNQFLDKWARKTLWIWLPFYGLQRLIKEVFLNKK